MKNADLDVISDFGREWAAFDQSGVDGEMRKIFETYFSLVDFGRLKDGVGFDCGCGSGRWAALVAPQVRELHCIDPASEALDVARRNLARLPNVRFHKASVADMPIANGSMDFGYSLGVLHHIPDTSLGIKDCVSKLKPGAPFVLYLYYAFDNRPAWFVALFKAVNLMRSVVSRLPFGLKRVVCDVIAATVYWPLAKLAKAFPERKNLPLHIYRDKSFYTMRTDALDRFGTRLEKRFTKDEISAMMVAAGLTDIRFSDQPPYWVSVGVKAHALAQ